MSKNIEDSSAKKRSDATVLGNPGSHFLSTASSLGSNFLSQNCKVDARVPIFMPKSPASRRRKGEEQKKGHNPAKLALLETSLNCTQHPTYMQSEHGCMNGTVHSYYLFQGG
jgi:hypothetical protein